jgi:NADH-quinone oxidoreductase subunit N
MNPVLAISPLLTVAVGALGATLLHAFTKQGAARALFPTSVLVCAVLLSSALWFGGLPAQTPAPLAPYLAVDALAQFFYVTICAGAALCALLADGYLREHGLTGGGFYATLLWCVFGAMVLASAADLLVLFIGLTTMSLTAYGLVVFRFGSRRSIENARKYFLLGALAVAIVLFGSALLYGATGHMDLRAIGEAIRTGACKPTLVMLAAPLLAVGLAFQVSAVPFHMWTPDAYQGAVTPVAAFISVVVKTAAFAVLLRVFVISFGDTRSSDGVSGWPPLFAALAVATMIYGHIAAMYQSSIKRMFAYSSIAHTGNVLIGVVAIFRARETAVSAVLYYLMAYTASNVLAFGSLIALGSKGKESVSYQDIAGAGYRHPLISLAFVLAVLSLMGFPPTAGFIAKYYIFVSALQTGSGMVWLVVVGAFASALGSVYYFRVIVYLYMKEPEPDDAPTAAATRSGYLVAALLFSAYVVLTMGATPSRYLDMALAAAASFI